MTPLKETTLVPCRDSESSITWQQFQHRGFDLRSRLPCTDDKSGLRPEMGKKWPKNGFWPHPEKEGKMAEKWENGQF